MAQNVSYASNDTILESLVLHTLPDFGEHGSGIINQNSLLAFLKGKDAKTNSSKRFEVVDGGLEFVNGVRNRENTNFKWQSHTADMTANLQDPNIRLRWDIMTFTGSVVINKKHEAMNKGKAMIKSFAKELREQAEETIPNQFNSAFWAETPAATEPESIPSIVSATPLVGSVGGMTRAGNTSLQNGAYTTAVADIGAEAGIAVLKRQIIRHAIGQGGKDAPDFGLMEDNLYAGLVGYLTTQQRYKADDMMANLDFDTVKIGNTTLTFENTNVEGGANTIHANYIYLLNSNHLKFKVLKDGNFMWNPDGFERVGQTLNKALYFWVFCNLTTNLPKSHVVMTAVSTT